MVLVRDKRRSLLAAEARIANELDLNAQVVERQERNYVTRQDMAPLLHFAGWNAEESVLHAVNKKDSGLWDEIAAVYNALKSAAWGGDQPSAAEMRDLAQRLRDAGF